ncbi:acyl carrier protein [Mesomycoplasma bovoculi]|uniref:Acyl carrier protein n=1 Tax=Mesomycoplasma bovoculi M165/69 TaxID=743966 RepID=W5USK7_9BACT|nr:acyl carrier protein [Mesomycoplasma bovoculi]AHH45086.1 acyl carrier protein [Mesomycoplasma bovoculi M165/69]
MQKIIYQKISQYTKQKFDDSTNIKDLGIDSLDFVEMVTDFEQKFNIEITDEELMEIKTVGDILELMKKYSSKIE